MGQKKAKTTGNMKITVTFMDKKQAYEMPNGATVQEVIDQHSDDLGLQGGGFAKIGGEEVELTQKLHDGDKLQLISAEAIYGANTVDISDMIGKGLKAIREKYGEALNLPAEENVKIEINGKPVMIQALRAIKAGERVEFIKPDGRKL